jgi:uncharacterized membrane protein YGL010W
MIVFLSLVALAHAVSLLEPVFYCLLFGNFGLLVRSLHVWVAVRMTNLMIANQSDVL